VFFIAIYLLLSVYIRIKFQFWHTQPVFHIYNLKYWFHPPGIINVVPPAVNKFVNLSNNSLVKIEDDDTKSISISIASISIASISEFIRDNYVIHDSTSYKPSKDDILAYLQCSNQPSFFNVYRETRIPFMAETDKDIIGVTSARLLNVTLIKKKSQHITIPVYYIDNLCVKPGYRKKGIAPEMIQTFYYTISRANPSVNAYMFKREGQLNAIVPIVCYDTYVFDMTHFCADTLLTGSMSLIEIGVPQLNQCIAFIKSQIPKFECVVLPDVSSVLNLVKLGKLKLYGILFQGELIALYVFRVLELYYGEKKAVECITIISDCDKPDILITGFTMSWQKIKSLVKCDILFLEETADSKVVISALDKNATVVRNFKSPTAFFLYNYATYSVSNSKALLLY
jgi:hypothetical protein